MIKTRKQMFLVIGAFVLVMMLSAVTYAFFNYTRTGVSNTIKVGRISFVTRQTETINLTNVFPISSSEATGENQNYDQVVIEIEGDTDYSGGIEYLVSAVDANIYTNLGQPVPISLDIKIDDDLGTENNNYFTARDNTNTSIYKKIVGNTLVGDGMLLVGYIAPNSSGNIDGIDGTITIKAYLDKNKILISDTYDGTELDNMGTTNNEAEGKTVITTSEWNALQQNGVSFKVKVEANEGIWVVGSLEEIMKRDNIGIDTENGVDFSKMSSDDGINGQGTKGIYMLSSTQNDTNPVLYYRGAVENNNVIFGDKCWKAVRTTDTGGVKLIYNGEYGNSYEKVALTFDQYTVVTNTDGVNNDAWTFNSDDNSWNISTTLANLEISFKVPNGENYSLELNGKIGEEGGGSCVIFNGSTSVDGIGGGPNTFLSKKHNYGTLTSDDVIKLTYSGSPLATTPTELKIKMYTSGDLITTMGCDNTASATHIFVNDEHAFPYSGTNMNNSPAYVGYMYGTVYENSYSNWTSSAKFGSSFTWDGTNYKLVDATVSSPNATHHYSCNSADANATCSNLRYVYYVGTGTKYYITLTGGDGIEDALRKMQTNTTDSTAKSKIDTWYASNMTNYTNKLEDTIFCNDRSFGDNNNNGWIANGGNLEINLKFGSDERSNFASNTSTVKNSPSLVCVNKNDRFTVNNINGNMNLTYPVALLTEDEVVLAGGIANNTNSTYYLANNDFWWTMSPANFPNHSYNFDVGDAGHAMTNKNTFGLRPAISIKPGQLIKSGNGTVVNPYVIE